MAWFRIAKRKLMMISILVLQRQTLMFRLAQAMQYLGNDGPCGSDFPTLTMSIVLINVFVSSKVVVCDQPITVPAF